MRFLLVNQFAPPSSAPTARVIGELAEVLRGLGHSVEIVATRGVYRGSRRGWRRIVAEASSILRLAGRLFVHPKVDRWLVLSSPPGLLLVAAGFASIRRIPLDHWVMDLYPDTAVAAGLIRPNGLLHRLVGAGMRWALGRCRKVWVLDEEMRTRVRGLGCESEVLELWPLQATARAAWSQQPERSWLYSGNLGRAHEWETMLAVQRLLEARAAGIRLVFQSRGAELIRAKNEARSTGLHLVEWRQPQPETKFLDSLDKAGVMVVTQRPEFQGCVWPSKLAVAARCPRPLLWIGPVEGSTAEWLRTRPATGIFAPGAVEEVVEWLRRWCGKPPEEAEFKIWLAKNPAPTVVEIGKKIACS